jgi:hypothetical protein
MRKAASRKIPRNPAHTEDIVIPYPAARSRGPARHIQKSTDDVLEDAESSSI